MKELFIPFTIPNFKSIQQELLKGIRHDYKQHDKPHAFTYAESYMKEHCPLFMSWLIPRLKLPVRLYRYYVTPPRSNLSIHIDGTNPTVPFALNIPILGTENTLHSFYETNVDNIEYKTGAGYLAATQPINLSKLKLISQLEIVEPHVTNNSVLHGITNDTDQFRIMFTVRWKIHATEARTIEECMDVSELFLNHY